jgi:hypothetical protein
MPLATALPWRSRRRAIDRRVTPAGPGAIDRHPLMFILPVWLICAALMLWHAMPAIAHLTLMDPDDAMRLQQVRDLLGGQSWFDVTQHRVNPPAGGPIHWSRLVDLPLAALILLVRPFLGQGAAETVASVAVPLLTLLALCLALYRATRLLADAQTARLATVLLVTTLSILIQLTPLRIDHHGWQIVTAGIALGSMFDPRARRGGLVSGVAMALWLQISAEALPYAALFAAVMGLRQLARPDENARLVGFAAAMALASVALLFGCRGWRTGTTFYCDSFSPVYLLPVGAFAAVLLVGGAVIREPRFAARLAIPALGGAVAVLLFLTLGRQCLAGPFETLGPVAYRLWYLQVLEGRPIWEQSFVIGGVILLPSLLGLLACLGAIRNATDEQARARWIVLLILLSGAMLISVAVLRAMAVAHLFAMPAIAWMLLNLARRVNRSGTALARVAGTVGLVGLTPVGSAMLWTALASTPETPAPPAPDCTTAASIAPLRGLPTGVVLAPLDISPAILIGTPHSVVGTAHHRNAAGITAVIRTFISPPERARAVVMDTNGGHGATYVVTCPGLNEVVRYARGRPGSLAARLATGPAPAWLEPLPIEGPLRIWRVRG